MRKATKQKIEVFKDLLLHGLSVRQALRTAHLGRSSYIRYYNQIFTPEFCDKLEKARFLWETEFEKLLVGKEKPNPTPFDQRFKNFEEEANRILKAKPTPLSAEKRKRLIETLRDLVRKHLLKSSGQ